MVFPLGDSEPTRITPVVTYVLIAFNVSLYLAQLSLGPRFTTAYAATPWEITHAVDLPEGVPRVEERGIAQATAGIPISLTLLTALFLHGSPLHLAGNMLYLWIFADNVEEVLGAFRFLLAYLTFGVVGGLLQVAAAPESLVPILGASAAVAGVLGAYMVWFPNHRIRVLILRVVVEIPALWVIVSWIVIQAVLGLLGSGSPSDLGGVAYAAHLGGAVVGIAVGLIYRDRAKVLERGRSADDWVPPPRPLDDDS